MKCCICGDKIEHYGNNPFPLCAKDDYESRCCDVCNTLVIKSRLAMAKNDDNINEGDTIAIFYAKESNAPTEMLSTQGKFLAGIVESVIQNNKNIEYKGSWGSFTINSETDQFVKI